MDNYRIFCSYRKVFSKQMQFLLKSLCSEDVVTEVLLHTSPVSVLQGCPSQLQLLLGTLSESQCRDSNTAVS